MSDEGVFIGYSMRSSAYTMFNKRLIKIEESVHVTFDENKKGMQHLLDLKEDEFIFQSSLQNEPVPSGANDDDKRPSPSSGNLPTKSTNVPN